MLINCSVWGLSNGAVKRSNCEQVLTSKTAYYQRSTIFIKVIPGIFGLIEV